ncbi:MAG: hypothetical protein CR997_09475 [Acidobacteria bacterium]|nr:MAG: hypothetical protein CR997_09475 [Acidobacteriota bacterium]
MSLSRSLVLVLTGFLLSVGSLYIALKVGFAVGISLLTIVVIKGIEASIQKVSGVFHETVKTSSSQDYGYYLSMTTGMSFSTVTLLSTVLAALVLSGLFPDDPVTLILWVVSLNVMGTFLAWFFRKHLEKAAFPSARAAVSLIENTDSQEHKAFWWTFSATSVWVFLKGFMKWIPSSVMGLSLSPVFLGLGGLLGFKTSILFFLGGLFFFLPEQHILGEGDELAWFSVSAMTVYMLIDFTAQKPWKELTANLLNKRIVLSLTLFSFVSLFFFHRVFGLSFFPVVLMVLLIMPCALLASRATAETDVAPIGALGKLGMVILFFIPFKGSLMPWIGQLIGPAAASSDFSSDLKCGSILKCRPGLQLNYQLAGAVIGPTVLIPVFLKFKELVGTDLFPAPAAQIWNQFLEMMSTDVMQYSDQLKVNLTSGAILGLAYWLVKKKVWNQLPSVVPFCMAYFLDFQITNTLLIGGFLAWILAKRVSKENQLLVWTAMMGAESIIMSVVLLGY